MRTTLQSSGPLCDTDSAPWRRPTAAQRAEVCRFWHRALHVQSSFPRLRCARLENVRLSEKSEQNTTSQDTMSSRGNVLERKQSAPLDPGDVTNAKVSGTTAQTSHTASDTRRGGPRRWLGPSVSIKSATETGSNHSTSRWGLYG